MLGSDVQQLKAVEKESLSLRRKQTANILLEGPNAGKSNS